MSNSFTLAYFLPAPHAFLNQNFRNLTIFISQINWYCCSILFQYTIHHLEKLPNYADNLELFTPPEKMEDVNPEIVLLSDPEDFDTELLEDKVFHKILCCAYMCLAPNERRSCRVLPKLGHISTEYSYFTHSCSTYLLSLWTWTSILKFFVTRPDHCFYYNS